MPLPHTNMQQFVTPIQQTNLSINNNTIYVKREDLLPFSFGGNKARKAMHFFEDILAGGFEAVVTYGSGSSNHCRVVANACARYGLECWIVSPEEEYVETFNSRLVQRFDAHIVKTPLEIVSETIEKLLVKISVDKKVYFIPGGGHGNIGTQAYVNVYQEILKQERECNVHFDYVFLASGTGTTQAGLVSGATLERDTTRKIVGISIARSNPRGGDVVRKSVEDYLTSVNYAGVMPSILFDDSYICGGYGAYNNQIQECIDQLMRREGIPLNRTYSGKAFWAMTEYLTANEISNCNVLFINTGGCPLFFDDMEDR